MTDISHIFNDSISAFGSRYPVLNTFISSFQIIDNTNDWQIKLSDILETNDNISTHLAELLNENCLLKECKLPQDENEQINLLKYVTALKAFQNERIEKLFKIGYDKYANSNKVISYFLI